MPPISPVSRLAASQSRYALTVLTEPPQSDASLSIYWRGEAHEESVRKRLFFVFAAEASSGG